MPDETEPAPTQTKKPTDSLPVLRPADYKLVEAATPVLDSIREDERVWKDMSDYSKKDGFGDSLSYTKALLGAVLTDTENNAAFSPLSLYFALASLAELSYGDTRDQILALLDASSMQTLRKTAKAMWLNVYANDRSYSDTPEICLPGASLWLNDASGVRLDPPTAELLKNNFFTSVYCGDASDVNYQNAFTAWLRSHTGGMLEDTCQSMRLEPETVFTLLDTLYLQTSWAIPFDEDKNTVGPFYGAKGTENATFMHMCRLFADYYACEGYSATSLLTTGNEKVWLLLPDAGETPVSLIKSGAYLDVLSRDYKNTELPAEYEGYEVSLSLPKFDISDSYALADYLEGLGVKDIFDPDKANMYFMDTVNGENLCVTEASQDVRIKVDEKGISAAAVSKFSFDMGDPLFYLVDFKLDRPFLVLVVSDCNTPLFAAVVNHVG